jgi:mRNA interferase YafQ
VAKLLRGEKLDEKYQVHQLHGNRKGQWECHIQPDWLLVWEQNETELILLMVNTGTHSDLFGKNKR